MRIGQRHEGYHLPIRLTRKQLSQRQYGREHGHHCVVVVSFIFTNPFGDIFVVTLSCFPAPVAWMDM